MKSTRSLSGHLDFGQGSILKNVLLSAGPMATAQVLSLLYNIVDRIYIGRIPGAGLDALGGVGICFPLIALISAFASLFGSGGAPLCAIEEGKGNHEEAQKYLNASFRLIVITGLVLMIGGQLFLQPLLTLFGADAQLMVYAFPYMQIMLWGTLFSMISLGMNPFINAQGYPAAGMMTILIGAVLNIILDPILIFGFHMGVQGAAWATIFSQAMSALFVFSFLRSKKASLHLMLPFRKHQQEVTSGGSILTRRRAGAIVSLGMAGFIMQVTNSLVQIVCNNMLLRTGGSFYVSIMTIVSSIRQILDTPIFGLTDGASPIMSFNYGAKKMDRLQKTIRLTTVLALGYTAIAWGCILLFPHFFVHLFNNDPSLDALASRALNIYFFAFIFQALQYSGQTVFKALNRKKQAIFFSLFRKVIIVVPLTILLPQIPALGAMGVFAAEPVSNVIGGSLCFAVMWFTVYCRLKKPEQPRTGC